MTSTLSASPTVVSCNRKPYVFMSIEGFDRITRVFRGDPYSLALMLVGELKLPGDTFGLGFAACGDKLFAFGGVTFGESVGLHSFPSDVLPSFPRDVYVCDVSKLDILGPGSGKWVKAEMKLKGPKPCPLVAVLDDRIYALQGGITSFISLHACKFCDLDVDKEEEEEEEEEEEMGQVLEVVDPVFEVLDTNFLDGGWTKLATPPFRYGRTVRAFTVVDNTIYMHLMYPDCCDLDIFAFDVIQGRWKDTISTNLTNCLWRDKADVVDGILLTFSHLRWCGVYGFDLLTCNDEKKEELAATPTDMDPMNEGKDKDDDATLSYPSDSLAENEEEDLDDGSSDISVGVLTEEEFLKLPLSPIQNFTNSTKTKTLSNDEDYDFGHGPDFPIHGMESITQVPDPHGLSFGRVTHVEDDMYCLTLFYIEDVKSGISHKGRICKFRLVVERNGVKVKKLRADDIEYKDYEFEDVLGYFCNWCTLVR